ncbi:UDP-N-acetylenolpyruvoylglucosamine reductase, partial [bacterium]
EKSAGCVFKNPTGFHAGELIQNAGLKGYSIGDAMVSKLHSNFIINRGNASAEDIMKLIRLIQQKVQDKFGVQLELEVRTVGF